MSRHFNRFPPYVPVSQRKAQSRRQLEALRKKGQSIEPLGELAHRTKIATSFWGQAWCRHLESFSDFENRLPRGRTYVRNGSVLHLAIEPGTVNALVQGSSLYKETIRVTPLSETKWRAIQARCQGRIGSLIELLQGRISEEIMAIVTDPDDGLFPKPGEIKLECSCPDWAIMCKHVAAVLYGIGARLDQRPELLFKLRGVDHNDLISSAADTSLATSAKPSGRRRTLDSSVLGDVFGIELDPQPTAGARRAKKGARGSRSTRATETAVGNVGRKAAEESAPKPARTPHFRATPVAIRRLRARLGLSRAAFAARLGVSPQSIANWETRTGILRLHATSLARLQSLDGSVPGKGVSSGLSSKGKIGAF